MAISESWQAVIDLCGAAVDGTVPDAARFSSLDIDRLLELARFHMVTAAVAMALESAGIKTKAVSGTIAAAQRRAILFQAALTEVEKGLEARGIWYMPLKGILLKDLYPRLGMREMSDHDLLFDPDRASDIRDMMLEMGYKAERSGVDWHDVYQKPPCLNFEMHTSLADRHHNSAEAWEYYADASDRLLGDGLKKHLSVEDFYIYMVYHAHRHYTRGGIGLRALLDIRVYQKANAPDMDYVAAEAKKLGIADFEAQCRGLSMRLFGGDVLTAEDEEMLKYMLSSGAHGTIENRVQGELQRTGKSPLRYALERLTVPVSRKNPLYERYEKVYPRFYRHKVLLPLLPVWRVAGAIKTGRFRAIARALGKRRTS